MLLEWLLGLGQLFLNDLIDFAHVLHCERTHPISATSQINPRKHILYRKTSTNKLGMIPVHINININIPF